MIGLLQRVAEASVSVGGRRIAAIDAGLLVLLGVQPEDTAARAERLVERLLNYRVFPDAEGRMNLSLQVTGGGLLLVPQFTLATDTSKGNRPSFTTAAPPALGRELFDCALACARQRHPVVAAGEFGAEMAVALINDGPVTFWLQT